MRKNTKILPHRTKNRRFWRQKTLGEGRLPNARKSKITNDKDIRAKYKGLVPACILDLGESERMLLTVRINRAKGVHVAIKMHELVTKVFSDYVLSKDVIAEQIGASRQEVELLLQEDVFTKMDTKNHKYSKAWIPA